MQGCLDQSIVGDFLGEVGWGGMHTSRVGSSRGFCRFCALDDGLTLSGTWVTESRRNIDLAMRIR